MPQVLAASHDSAKCCHSLRLRQMSWRTGTGGAGTCLRAVRDYWIMLRKCSRASCLERAAAPEVSWWVVVVHAATLLTAAFGQLAGEQGPSDADLTILFSVSVAFVIGLALYIARDVIFRRRTGYDKMDAGSKRNRDYEKYHSEWSDDYQEFGRKGVEDDEFEEMAEDGQLGDYYRILGVPRDATQKEIKERFRELAKEMHPDRASGSSDLMAEINRAYEVLSDEDRRRRYDRHLGD